MRHRHDNKVLLPQDPDENLSQQFGIDQIEARPLRHKATIVGLSLAALTLATLGGLGNWLKTDNSATVDLNTSTNEVAVKKVVWKEDHALDPATLYFEIKATNSGMKYDLHIKPLFGHGPELPINPRVNKSMEGDGAEHFDLPFSAIRQKVNPVTNKIDFTVDMTKVTADINWTGAYPNIKNFTYDGNKKNFSDQAGFRKQLIDMVSSDFQFVDLNGLTNKVNGIDQAVEHDMKQRGLDAFKQCNVDPKFDDRLKHAITGTIKDNVQWLHRGNDFGTVDFKGDLVASNISTGQTAEKLLGNSTSSDYALKSGEYKLDNLNCSPPAVSQLSGGN